MEIFRLIKKEQCILTEGAIIERIRNRNFQMKILGGCCGTDDRHIAAISERL